MSIVACFIFFLLGVILILVIVIIILSFVIKKYRNKERRLFNQKRLDREGFKRNLREKKEAYNEKAKKADNLDDLLDLTDKLVSDGYYPNQGN